MIMSNAKMREIKEHFVKPVGPISPLSYSTEAGVNFIGNVAL